MLDRLSPLTNSVPLQRGSICPFGFCLSLRQTCLAARSPGEYLLIASARDASSFWYHKIEKRKLTRCLCFVCTWTLNTGSACTRLSVLCGHRSAADPHCAALVDAIYPSLQRSVPRLLLQPLQASLLCVSLHRGHSGLFFDQRR